MQLPKVSSPERREAAILLLPDSAHCWYCTCLTLDPVAFRNRLICLPCAIDELTIEKQFAEARELNQQSALRAAHGSLRLPE